jgi:hypothetical protein
MRILEFMHMDWILWVLIIVAMLLGLASWFANSLADWFNWSHDEGDYGDEFDED